MQSGSWLRLEMLVTLQMFGNADPGHLCSDHGELVFMSARWPCISGGVDTRKWRLPLMQAERISFTFTLWIFIHENIME